MRDEEDNTILVLTFGFGIVGSATGVPNWTTDTFLQATLVTFPGPDADITIQFDGDLSGASVIVPPGGNDVLTSDGRQLCGGTYTIFPPG